MWIIGPHRKTRTNNKRLFELLTSILQESNLTNVLLFTLFCIISLLSSQQSQVWVRIGPQYPFHLVIYRNQIGPLDETAKPEVLCHCRCCTIKIPPRSKAISAEQRPTFCIFSPTMVTSPYERNILEQNVKKQTNNSRQYVYRKINYPQPDIIVELIICGCHHQSSAE